MICKFIKQDGKQCQANAMRNKEFCFTHHPDTKELVKEAGRKGGKVSIYDKGLVLIEPIDILKNRKTILWILADTINRVRRVRPDGSLDIKTANAIGFLCSKMIEAQNEVEIEKRIDKLEEALKQQGAKR